MNKSCSSFYVQEGKQPSACHHAQLLGSSRVQILARALGSRPSQQTQPRLPQQPRKGDKAETQPLILQTGFQGKKATLCISNWNWKWCPCAHSSSSPHARQGGSVTARMAKALQHHHKVQGADGKTSPPRGDCRASMGTCSHPHLSQR